MPWHIILVFFFLGVLMGVNSGKKGLKSIQNATQNRS